MTRYTRPPFQTDKPLFCKVPLRARGRVYEAGAQFKWQEMKIDPKRVRIMYTNGDFYHSDELEEKLEPTIGDGLEEMNLETLHKLVEKINEKVNSLKDPKIRTCKKSNIKMKQVGLIRSWRIYHGEVE